uniref:RING-type domain-containing protein n=1 Tax=Panagrolaimus davidi TaxID=227884 RepID=A0A914R3P5_9BILA
MSEKSPEIGQCPICLSNINKSNIYAISKCGHTFHQKCIHQWISSAYNCPTCRTNAFKCDIIKLFIQENNVETVIPQKEEILPYIEKKYDGFFRRIMKECRCQRFQYETGDLEYKCLKDFDINICSYENSGKIQIILPEKIILNTYQSKTLDIIRGKTNKKSIVDPNGKLFEHFYEGMRNGEFFITTRNKETCRSNKFRFPKFTIKRSLKNGENGKDFVRQNKNRIKFCFPKFTIKRSLKNGENGKVTIHVYSDDPKKSLEIQICPEHQSFFVEHLFEKKITRCTNSEYLCDHLHE